MPDIVVRAEAWPIRGRFAISHGAKTEAHVVLVGLKVGDNRGRGECAPYARHGESSDSVIEQIESLRLDVERGLTRTELQQALPAGAARNALDCAFWDLQAKTTQQRICRFCEAVVHREVLDIPLRRNPFLGKGACGPRFPVRGSWEFIAIFRDSNAI